MTRVLDSQACLGTTGRPPSQPQRSPALRSASCLHVRDDCGLADIVTLPSAQLNRVFYLQQDKPCDSYK